MTRIYFLLLIFCGLWSHADAQNTLVQWNFNSAVPDNNTATGDTLPSTGSGTLQRMGGVTWTFASGTGGGDVVSADNSAINLASFPASPAVNPQTAGMQINFNSTGYSNLVLAFSHRPSSSSANTMVIQYNLNRNAGTWVNFRSIRIEPTASSGNTFYFRSIDLSAVAGLNNNALAAIRIVSDVDSVTGSYRPSTSTSTYATNGTWRFDVLRITDGGGTVVPTSIAFQTAQATVSQSAGQQFVKVQLSQPAQLGDSVTYSVSYAATSSSSDVTLGSGFVANQLVRALPVGIQVDSFAYTPVANNAVGENDTLYFNLTQLKGNLQLGTITQQMVIITGPTPSNTTVPLYTTAQVRGLNVNGGPDSLGAYCRLRGVIFAPTQRPTGNTGFQTVLKDATGGITLFRNANGLNYLPAVGDSVVAFGTVSVFRGLAQLNVDSIFLLGTGRTLPAPRVLGATDTLNELTESDYVRINNLTIVSGTWPSAGSSANLTVSNGVSQYLLRIVNSTDIDGAPAPTGPFSLVGLGSQFTSASTAPWVGGYQILPRSLQDIIQSQVDLTIGRILQFPDSLLAGRDTSIKVSVRNLGNSISSNYHVQLFVNGFRVDSVGVSTGIPAGDSALVSLNLPSASSPCGIYQVLSVVRHAGDIVPGNDSLVNAMRIYIPTPTISLSGDTTFCSNDSLTLSVPASAYAAQWQRNGQDIPGASGLTYVVKQSGSYRLKWTGANNCQTFSRAYQVTANTLPSTPTITSSGPLTFCAGSSVTLTAPAATSYTWLRNDTLVIGQSNASLNVSQSGQYKVEVGNASGCKQKSAATTVVVNPVLPVSVTITTASNTICQNSNVQFTAQVTNGGSSPVYQWKINNVNVGANNAVFTTNSLSNNDVVSVQVTSNAICAQPVTALSNSLVMTVTPQLSPGVTISANQTTVCEGANVSFTANLTNGGSNPQYQWTRNGQNVGTASTYSSNQLSNGDTIRLTITSNAACAQPQAITSNFIRITVNPLLTPSVAIAANSTNLCVGGTAFFTATPSNGGNNPSFQWQVNGQNVGGNSTTFNTTSLLDGQTVTVKMTSNALCAQPQQVTSNGLTVSVSSLVSPTVVAAVAANPICQGSSANFSIGSSSGGGSSPSFQWFVNGVQKATGTTFSANNLGNGDSVRVQMTSSFACANPATILSDALVLNVTPPVQPSVSITTQNQAICPGQTAVFQANPVNGGSAPLYQWFVNGNSQGAASTNSSFSSSTLVNNDKVRVQLTSNAGCLSATQALSAELTIQVQPSAAATVQLTASANNLCGSSPVVFRTTSGLGGTNPQFQWYVNNQLSSNIADTLVLTNPSDFDSVRVVMTSNASCASPAVASSSTIVLRVNPNPTAPVISANGSLILCSGEQVVLSAPTGSNLQWLRNNVAIPTETGLSINASLAGAYTLKTTGVGGCTSLSNALTVVVNSLPPTPSVTPSGALTFCQGGSVLLTSSALSGNQWLLNNAPLTGATATSLSVQAGGQYKVQVANGNGCKATSAPIVVTVNALPGVPSINNSGTSSICAGDTVVLSTPNAQSYQWFESGQPISSANTASLSVFQTGAYTVKITNASGCERTSNVLNILVNTRPTVPQVLPQSNTTFCQGGQLILKSTASTNNQWLKNGSPITGATTDSLLVTQSGQYSVLVTNAAGCSAVSSQVQVQVNDLPVLPQVTANGPLTFCAGNQITLRSSAAGGNQWLLNGQSIAGGLSDSLVVNATGLYSVRVTNISGCQRVSSTVNVVVKALPAQPTINAANTAICDGESIWLVSTPSTGYQWLFNGQPVANAADDSLLATLGGQYSVVATNTDGCSSTSSAFSLTINPLPSIPTISSAGSLTVCLGQKVTLFSSAASNNQWYKNGIAVSGATADTLQAFSSGDYKVEVTSAQGCKSMSLLTSVVVNPLPSAPAIGISGPLSFCQGDTVKLGVTTNLNRQWLLNGAAIPGAISDSLMIQVSGTYTLLVADNNGCQNQSTAFNITVRPLPTTPQITASGPLSFCQGSGLVILRSSSPTNNQWYLDGLPGFGLTLDSLAISTTSLIKVGITNAQGCTAFSSPVQVTALALPSTPTIQALSATTFCSGAQVRLVSSQLTGNQWLQNGQLIAGQTADTLLVTSTGTYTVKVTNAQNCSSTSAPIIVTVNPLPPVPTISASGPTTFCDGLNVRLTSSLTGGNQWNLNGQPILNAIQDTLRVSASGAYSIRFTNAQGCTSESSPLNVVVNPLPLPVNINSTGALTFCQGGQVVLRAGSAASAYQWWRNGQLIAGAMADSLVATQAGAYVLQVFNNSGCSSLSANANVVVNPLPATPVLNLSGNQSLCAGSSLILTTSASGIFQWLLNGLPISGAIDDTLTVIAAGNYTLQISNSNGCSSLSSPVNVNLVPLPPKPNIIRVNDSLLSNAPSGNQWYLVGFGPFPNGTNQSFVPATAGSYFVTVTVNGCTSPSSDTIAFVGSATQALNGNLPLKVWPNPSNGDWFIQVQNENQGTETQFELSDLTGKTIRRESSVIGQSNYQIRSEGLTSGLYLLKVIQGVKSATVKIQLLR